MQAKLDLFQQNDWNAFDQNMANVRDNDPTCTTLRWEMPTPAMDKMIQDHAHINCSQATMVIILHKL